MTERRKRREIGCARSVSGSSHPPCVVCEARQLGMCSAVDARDSAAAERDCHGPLSCRRALLFEEGDPADHVFTITAGMLKLYKLMSRRPPAGLGLPGAGRLPGPRLRPRLHVCSAEAIAPATVCRIRRAPFLALLDDCPALEKEILPRTATELAAAQEQMLLLGRKTALRACGELPPRPCPAPATARDDRSSSDGPGRHRRLSGPDHRNGQPNADPVAARTALIELVEHAAGRAPRSRRGSNRWRRS